MTGLPDDSPGSPGVPASGPSEAELEASARDLRTDLESQRVVEASGARPARYRLDLTNGWNAALFPFGGFVSAVALAAARAELGVPEHVPRTATTVFSSPVREGEVEIDVRVLRRGRGMSQVEVGLRNAGEDAPGHTTLAVFGRGRPGPGFTDVRPPDVPEPLDCELPPVPPAGAPMARAAFFDRLEVRSHGMRATWDPDWEAGGPARAIRWLRYRRAPRLEDGTLDPLAYVPVCDTMPPSLFQKLGPQPGPMLAPSCDLNVHFLRTTKSEWWLLDGRTHDAGDGYASATIDLWDADRRLLARATQLMYLRMDVPELRG